MERKQLEISGLSPPLVKILSAETPVQARMDAARGLAPLKPGDLVTVLYCLGLDKDRNVRQTASKTMSSLPQKIILSSIDSPLPPEVLDMIAEKFAGDQEIISKVVLHNNTADETIEVLARSCPAGVIGLIGRNQVRYLRSPSIIKSVSENPMAPAPLVESMIEFAERSGIDAGVFSKRPVKSEDVQEPGAGPENDTMAAPDPTAENVAETAPVAEAVVTERVPSVIPETKTFDDPDIPSRYIEEGKDFTDQEIKDFTQWMEGQKKERLQILSVNCNQNAAQILSRNKDVEIALKLLENKRITTPVWVKIAGERRTNDVLIKKMSEKKDMTRVYNIRIKLALHPRTPIPTAMGLVRGLRLNDLKTIAKNKSISPTIMNTAKGLLKMYGIKDPEKKE